MREATITTHTPTSPYCSHCGRRCTCGTDSVNPIIVIAAMPFNFVVPSTFECIQTTDLYISQTRFLDELRESISESVPERIDKIAYMRSMWQVPRALSVPCRGMVCHAPTNRRKPFRRRMLFSHSGWIGRAGREKRGQK
jgi:hypothetical protein